MEPVVVRELCNRSRLLIQMTGIFVVIATERVRPLFK